MTFYFLHSFVKGNADRATESQPTQVENKTLRAIHFRGEMPRGVCGKKRSSVHEAKTGIIVDQHAAL